MSSLQFLVAVALLTAPPDSSPSKAEFELIDSASPALQQLAVQLEILDPREVKYILSRSEDYRADIKELRRRFADLADAPSVQDIHRFPDRNLINELLSFNRSFRQNLDAQQSSEGFRAWEFREALQETDHLYEIWDKLRDARCDYYYVTVRRRALQRLHEMIGEEAYWAGVMPPYVPIWRFRSID